MTKIKNKISYKVKNIVVGTDYIPMTNSEHDVVGMSYEQTVSTTFDAVKNFVLAGLNPETGGQMKITEIEVSELDTDISTTINALSPSYEIAPYELVFFFIENHIYLSKVVNVAIGEGQDELSNSDFIDFPVSVGPTGASGVGIETITKTGTSGLVDTYTIGLSNSSEYTFTVTNANAWRSGSGVPSNSLGANTDYYLNTANGDVYLKSAGTYSIVANIKGANGSNGNNGADGADGNDGTFLNVQDLTKTTSFVLQASDDKKTFFVENGASDITVTVPTGLPSAFYIAVVRKGTGNITFVTSGTTINNPVGLKIDQRYDVVVLEQEGSTNTFELFGNTKA